MAVMEALGGYATKKNTQYAELTRVIIDSHNKSFSVKITPMIKVTGL
jgi:hypothetical protein